MQTQQYPPPSYIQNPFKAQFLRDFYLDKADLDMIVMACLNIPSKLRYKPENLYLVGIIPGPDEPALERLNHYMRPLVSDLLIS